MKKKRNHITVNWASFGKLKHCILMCLVIVLTVSLRVSPTTAAAETDGSQGILNVFYPSTAVFSTQMQQYIDQVDSVCFAWSRIDAEDPGTLNTEKAKNGNNGFYYPKDYLQPIEYAKNQGKSIQLNIFMDGSDAKQLLPYDDKQTLMIQAIIDYIQKDITQGNNIYYDGVVIDFEGLRDTGSTNQYASGQGEPISSCFNRFLTNLKAQLDTIGKKLYVAVNPGIYTDGYDYASIIDIADSMILMAHDYEPLEKLTKSQVQQYTGYDALEPISSPAPFPLIRQALNEIRSEVSDPAKLSKVWLQICFDSAQWKYNVDNANGWDTLSSTALSITGRKVPLYKTIKDRIDNIDGNGKSITYGYNNELQCPFIQYYNISDKTWNIILYEDSNSISAKINLSKEYGLGGISVWSLSNMPDYNDSIGKMYHLDGWSAIISAMSSYNELLPGSSQIVSFNDSAVEQAIRDKLGIESGDITRHDLQGIYRLKLDPGVNSLKDLEYLTNLEYLNAGQLGIVDISAIAGLTNLRVLYMPRNQITDLTALKKLTRLEILSLNGNQIVSLRPIASLTNLQKLYLRENKINSITSLSKLTKLSVLELGSNSIQKVDGLKNLRKLTGLALDNNQISDISAIIHLTKLQTLDLSNNKLSDLRPIKALSGLTSLYLQRNLITGISPLSGLTSIRIMSLNGNRISDLKPLAKLTTLEKLYLKDNKIKSVTALKGLLNLTELYLSGNQITNYSALDQISLKQDFLCDF